MKKEKNNGLTAAQKRLPPALQAAIAKKNGGKKNKDTDDEDLKHPEKADLDEDGKLSRYEKKRAKAIEDAMDDDEDEDEDDNKKKCGMYMDKDDEEEEEEECTCGCDDPKDCTCGDKKESRWTGSSLPTFNEWLKWRNNINEVGEEGVFGRTGNPAHPYAPKRGPDVYYNQSAANMSDDQVMEIFRKAKAGLDAFSAYAQVMAMRGDMAGMEARDAAYEALAQGQHPEGFGAFKKTGYTGR